MSFDAYKWINEPREWAAEDGLRVVADPDTDLWQKAHYGYSFDNAPMFVREVEGDTRIRATFSADYADQYDQAGAILRIDEENWVKAGVEFVDGAYQLSVVVTRGYSDWSVVPAPGTPESVTIDIAREGDAVIVRYGLDGAEPVHMLRLAYFPPEVRALAGAMCAAPRGGGFEVRFTRLSVV
jgi:regulation of enolase protein 1 (concanavalin A-like superfamily)